MEIIPFTVREWFLLGMAMIAGWGVFIAIRKEQQTTKELQKMRNIISRCPNCSYCLKQQDQKGIQQSQ